MARLEWVILTERTIVEAQTNVVSLQSIVENVNLPPPPPAKPEAKFLVPFRFYVNQQWVRSESGRGEQIDGRLLLCGPNKKPYLIHPFHANLQGSLRARVVTSLMGFPGLGEGEYPVIVQALKGKRWQAAGRTQFTVVIRQELGTQTESPLAIQ